MGTKLLDFVTPGDTQVIEVEEHACDADEVGGQGHIYYIEGSFTLGDLATLTRMLQQRECPGISATGWAQMQRGNCTLKEVEDDREADE